MSEPAVLTSTRLDYEYVGPAAKAAKGWVVSGAGGQVVATVPQKAGLRFGIAPPPDLPLVDAGGRMLARVAAEQERHEHRIEDARGELVAVVARFEGDWERAAFDLAAGSTAIARIELSTTSTSITGVTVTDPGGETIASIAQHNQRISFLKGRTWFALERRDGLADPLRLVVVTAPLLIHADLELRELRANTGRVQRNWRPL